MPAMFESGFCVRQPSWHGLENLLDFVPEDWGQVRKLAGFEWDPVESPAYDAVAWDTNGNPTAYAPIEGWKQLKRSDTKARLHIAEGTYHVIDHDMMGQIYDAVMDDSRRGGAGRAIQYETAGVLDGGKRVWVLARLGDEIELPGDPSPMQPFCAILNSHDGSAALKVIETNVRIVCANTWHAADMDASVRGTAYSFRHTKNWKDRVEEAKAALASTNARIDETITMAREMLDTKITAIQERAWIQQFARERTIATTIGKLPRTKKALEERFEEPRVQKSLEHTLTTLHAIMESPTTEGIRGTMWGVVQAAGEFADHFRDTKSAETYFSRTVLAEKEPLKQLGVRLAREVLTEV